MAKAAVRVSISTPRITLGEFLKWAGIAGTGGAAKVLVQRGQVAVNGVVERRRGRQLGPGDLVAAGGREYRVAPR
ncbi:MAG TPA: RNA-binding S4 domain-containing protein [bacterium]|nr:RNA-binding S4 domain-containing protein [bacterium]